METCTYDLLKIRELTEMIAIVDKVWRRWKKVIGLHRTIRNLIIRRAHRRRACWRGRLENVGAGPGREELASALAHVVLEVCWTVGAVKV